MKPRIRVLLIAEACNPTWTSVPLLAYYWYRALREHADVLLLTQERNREGFSQGGLPSDVEFVDTEPLARPLYQLGGLLTRNHPTALGARGAISMAAYYYFEQLVWQRYGRALRLGRFDLVHRLTPLSPTVPSPLVQRCPVPFVLGPLNGALPWPRGSEHVRKREGEWLTPVRSAYRLLPGWRQTFERAALILSGARHVLRDIPRRARARTVIMAENGVDISRFHSAESPRQPQPRPFTILFVGRLVPFKQPALILDAVARMPARNDVRVVYAGDGPERSAVEAAAQRLGLTRQVRILGHVPHDELPALYRQASVFALPSVHESGGAVLLEAMACGLPCVVLDYGGPAEYVDALTGFRIPIGAADTMVTGLGEAFTLLCQDPELQRRMSAAARARVAQEYAWDCKAQQVVRWYRQTLETGACNS